MADAVHAVVPVAGADERQAVRAGGDAFLDGAAAVLEERAVFADDRRQVVSLVLALGQRRRRQERRLLVEDPASPVTRTYSATTNGSQSRSSEQRLRSPRPERLVPPVLHVAFDELAAGRAEDVLARELRRG